MRVPPARSEQAFEAAIARTARSPDRARSEREFHDVFRREHEEAKVYARQYVGMWGEDAVQEAFIDLWENFYAVDEIPGAGARHLFYRILRRRLIDRIRSMARDHNLQDSRDHLAHVVGRLYEQSDTARVAEGHLLEERVTYIASTLPPICRAVFDAARALDWDVKAAAAQLGLSYGTARWHFMRATRLLRERLSGDGYLVPDRIGRGRRGAYGRQDP